MQSGPVHERVSLMSRRWGLGCTDMYATAPCGSTSLLQTFAKPSQYEYPSLPSALRLSHAEAQFPRFACITASFRRAFSEAGQALPRSLFKRLNMFGDPPPLGRSHFVPSTGHCASHRRYIPSRKHRDSRAGCECVVAPRESCNLRTLCRALRVRTATRPRLISDGALYSLRSEYIWIRHTFQCFVH